METARYLAPRTDSGVLLCRSHGSLVLMVSPQLPSERERDLWFIKP